MAALVMLDRFGLSDNGINRYRRQKAVQFLLHEDIKALRQEMNSFGREVTTALNKLSKD